jgi:hypothetical protein
VLRDDTCLKGGVMWWGDVDYYGLGLFRHLEEGLAASLYLVDGL